MRPFTVKVHGAIRPFEYLLCTILHNRVPFHLIITRGDPFDKLCDEQVDSGDTAIGGARRKEVPFC